MSEVSEAQVDEYLETVLWTSHDGNTELDRDFSVDDFTPEARAKARQDLERFWFEAKLVFDALGDEVMEKVDLEQWPYDFWLTRNGHGVGFWDEMYREAAEPLTVIAQRFGESYAQVGDDDRVHLD